MSILSRLRQSREQTTGRTTCCQRRVRSGLCPSASVAKDPTGGGHGCLPCHQLQKAGPSGPERTEKGKWWPKAKVKMWRVQCWHFEVEETIGWLACSLAHSALIQRVCSVTHGPLSCPGRHGAELLYAWGSDLDPRLPKLNSYLCGLKKCCFVFWH